MQRTIEQAVRNIARRYLDALRDDNASTREDAARALGELRTIETMEPLIALLNDPVPKVQIAAAEALGKIGDPRALPALEQKAMESSVAGVALGKRVVPVIRSGVGRVCVQAAASIRQGDKAQLPRSASAVELNTESLPRAASSSDAGLKIDMLPRAATD